VKWSGLIHRPPKLNMGFNNASFFPVLMLVTVSLRHDIIEGRTVYPDFCIVLLCVIRF
jgi:hypothetical protein